MSPWIPNTTISAAQLPTDGWTSDSATPWTYASATTFTITGQDQTVKFSKGTRLKLTQTTVKYFVVVDSTFGGGNTTVTITGGTDYTFANAAISANYYSYAVNPQGYPGFFAYTPTYTGFSADPGSLVCNFFVVGKMCFFNLYAGSNGTSNATGFTITLPIVATLGQWGAMRYIDNGVSGAAPGMWELSGSTMNFYKDWNGAAWTASGAKNVYLTSVGYGL